MLNLILDQFVFTLENTVGFQPNRNAPFQVQLQRIRQVNKTRVHWKWGVVDAPLKVTECSHLEFYISCIILQHKTGNALVKV